MKIKIKHMVVIIYSSSELVLGNFIFQEYSLLMMQVPHPPWLGS